MKKQTAGPKTASTKKGRVQQTFPPGWDKESVKAELAYFENQTPDEQLAENEAAFSAAGQSVIVVPTELLPAIRPLIPRHARPHGTSTTARNGRRAPDGN